MKEWLFLIGAIVLETFATTMLKYSEQFTKIVPTIAMAVGYLLSFYCLSHEGESEHGYKQQVTFLQKLHFAIFHKFRFILMHFHL